MWYAFKTEARELAISELPFTSASSPGVKPFVWKLVLFTCKYWFIYMWIKLIFIWKALHRTCFETEAKGNSEITYLPMVTITAWGTILVTLQFTQKSRHLLWQTYLYSVTVGKNHMVHIKLNMISFLPVKVLGVKRISSFSVCEPHQQWLPSSETCNEDNFVF